MRPAPDGGGRIRKRAVRVVSAGDRDRHLSCVNRSFTVSAAVDPGPVGSGATAFRKPGDLVYPNRSFRHRPGSFRGSGATRRHRTILTRRLRGIREDPMSVTTKTRSESRTSARLIEQAETWSAHNYHPLPVVLSRGEGVWV